MRNYKLTSEQLAKIVALQLWGISQQTDNPLPPVKLDFYIEHYKREFNKPNILGLTLEQIKRIKDYEKEQIEKLAKKSIDEVEKPVKKTKVRTPKNKVQKKTSKD